MAVALVLSIFGPSADTLSGGRSTGFFAGMVANDPMAAYFRILCISVAILAAFAAFTSRELRERRMGEFLMLLTTVTLGMVLLAQSVNLLMLYLSLELVSIPSYGLVAYLRRNRPGMEAALKYILMGALATGTMLYGITLLYGLTGSYDLAAIGQALSRGLMTGPEYWGLLMAAVMVLAGFGFKIAAVPFHFWAPDVYTGAPTPVSAFLTIGPKAAGFAALIRFTLLSLGGREAAISWASGVHWQALLMGVAVLTMFLGNLSAFFQNDLKRLLGYSSIAHAGFMLMGLVAMTKVGVHSVLMYLAIYLFMNLGAFVVVIFLHNQAGTVDISGLRGIARSSPVVAGAMAILTLSLMGIPPLAGFWAKYYVFWAVIDQKIWWLAVVGGINAVFGYFYYARILKAMYLEKPDIPAEGEERPDPVRFRLTVPQWVLLLFLALPNLLFLVVLWGPLDRFARAASHLLGITL
jgi:NADH-quinone oxidoreductase subunit N